TAHRSVPGMTSRIRLSLSRLPSGAVRTTPAATASWPSLNTVAETSKVSPATALAGHCPQSTTGEMSVMGIRPIIAFQGLRRHSVPPEAFLAGSILARQLRAAVDRPPECPRENLTWEKVAPIVLLHASHRKGFEGLAWG